MAQTYSPAEHQFLLDLVYDIVAFLEGDAQTIRTFSLTSKAWYHISRPYIYRTIILNGPSQYIPFEKLLGENEEVRPWIRKLHFKAGEDWRWTFYAAPPLQISPGFLPKLSALEFDCAPFRIIDNLDPHTLRTLILRHQTLKGSDLVNIGRHFPLLSTLEVTSSIVEDYFAAPVMVVDEEPGPAHERYTLPLQNLVASVSPRDYRPFTGNVGVLPWVLRNGSSATLRSLSVNMKSGTSPCLGIVRSFFDTLGNTLEELTLELPPPWQWHKYVKSHNHEPLSLSHLTGLRSLTLIELRHTCVVTILSAPLPLLRQITLELQTDSGRLGGMRQTEYKPLDVRFCHPGFSSLEAVNIVYIGVLDEETVAQKLAHVFPHTHAKGLLHVRKDEEKSRHISESMPVVNSTRRRRKD